MRSQNTPSSPGFALVGRLVLYALAVGLLLERVVEAARQGDVEAWMREDGVVETIQLGLALASASAFTALSLRRKPFDVAMLLAGLACAFAAGRELDGWMGMVVGPHGYKLLVVPVGFVAAGVLVVSRARTADAMRDFIGTPSCWLGFLGAFLILVHAQVLGQKELWSALLDDERARTVKKSFEECSELTGYCLLACAAVEGWIAHVTRVRRSS